MYAYIDSFRNFGKTNTDNQSIKIKRPYPYRDQSFSWMAEGGFFAEKRDRVNLPKRVPVPVRAPRHARPATLLPSGRARHRGARLRPGSGFRPDRRCRFPKNRSSTLRVTGYGRYPRRHPRSANRWSASAGIAAAPWPGTRGCSASARSRVRSPALCRARHTAWLPPRSLRKSTAPAGRRGRADGEARQHRSRKKQGSHGRSIRFYTKRSSGVFRIRRGGFPTKHPEKVDPKNKGPCDSIARTFLFEK